MDHTKGSSLRMSENNNITDQDESLLEVALELGGDHRESVDLATGEIVKHGVQLRKEIGLEINSLLSTLHNSPQSTSGTPQIEYAAGGSLLKVSSGIVSEAPIGGKRGAIGGFSFASRRRLMRTIARVKRDAKLPFFVTLTYPNKFPSPIESKRHLDNFAKRLRREFSDIGFLWKLEPQGRGAPHYHLLVWGVQETDLFYYVPFAWYEIAGDRDRDHLLFHMGCLKNQHCVSEVRSWRGVWSYASKYLGKTFEVAGWDCIYPGRFWGVVNRENIPFGDDMVMYVTEKDARLWMRYQRRFGKLKSRNYSSLTTFCDADQWVKNFLG